MVAQLWHVGRISHSSLHPEQGAPEAPSAIAPSGQTYGADWKLHDYETPKAMTTEDIARLLKDFELAAANAKAAGFDGVEIHSANGYLLDQFLQDKTNQRTDEYGGSIENRVRLLGEVISQLLKYSQVTESVCVFRLMVVLTIWPIVILSPCLML